MNRQIKSKDIFGYNYLRYIWIYLAKVHHLKELTFPYIYIVSYLKFLNLNNILTLPILSLPLKLCLI